MKTKTLDEYRFFLAFLVVAIHISPFLNISPTLDILFTRAFCRIAVPIFLMITGYYVLPKALKDKKELIKYTKKILKIYGICILLYLPINFYAGQWNNLGILSVIKRIVIDGTFYHLWYFPALILGLWITYGILKLKKGTIGILILLYLIGLLGDSYYGIIQNSMVLKSFYDFLFTIFDYTRNGIFYTPVFLYLGYFFKERKIKCNQIGLVISFLCLLIEAYLVYLFNLPRHDSMYIFLIPTLYFLFPFLLKNTTPNKKIRFMATAIYILHPFVLVILRMVAKILHLEFLLVENNLTQYLFVCLFTYFCAYLISTWKEVGKK